MCYRSDADLRKREATISYWLQIKCSTARPNPSVISIHKDGQYSQSYLTLVLLSPWKNLEITNSKNQAM